MKAMQLTRIAPIHERPLSYRELLDPKPSSNELLVQVEACAICRTDLHVIEGDLPTKRLPIVPGHQVVGRVIAAGREARKFESGKRVGIAWLRHTCRSCDYCRTGRENLCAESLYTGYHTDGGFAELATVHEDFAYPLAEDIEAPTLAPFLCAGIIGYRALKRAELPLTGKLGIFGFGSSAHLTMQLARQAGLEVFVATRNENHRQLARQLGASWVGDGSRPFPTQVHSVIVFAPAGELVPIALQSVGKGGRVVLAGVYMSDVPSMKYQDCLFHEKVLTTVEANTRDDGFEMFKLINTHIRPQITCFPLAEANEALIALKEDRLTGTGVLVM